MIRDMTSYDKGKTIDSPDLSSRGTGDLYIRSKLRSSEAKVDQIVQKVKPFRTLPSSHELRCVL